MTDSQLNEYLSVKHLAQEFTSFSEASIRYHIFHSDTNGLRQSIRRIGRKVLISKQGFHNWIENEGKVGCAKQPITQAVNLPQLPFGKGGVK